ncbi:hypothetical protein ACOPYF_004808 [Klebsiella pneumoniae]|uniref:hypothetical protein n=1 Tax=Klebsiella TaxID=570 RepID=UPI00069DB905|nr:MULTISPECIES: hypothetical protein [Klebsiella]EKV4911626.1 hypothetical protein [Klebsiella pneumoniae]MCE0160110.1 hypothetical protein [Klebsiella variicola subsp. variicola]MDE4743838.1 hypothetical protein [Klebsiella pneumoniae]MDE4765556.1 hypothetical protein [Klebsiella pneumoniae]MDM4545015.1 hypothetical protein [Klebsiella oxytoca]
MSDSDNENYYPKGIGKLGAEELARPEEPLHEGGSRFTSPESEFSIDSWPEDESAQAAEDSDIEVRTGEPISSPPVSESSNNATRGDEAFKRLMQNMQAGEKRNVKTKSLHVEDSSCLQDVDLKWLKGEVNSRAIFWFWAYIRKASARELYLPEDTAVLIPEWDQREENLYSFFRLSGNPTSSAERSRVIITFMNKLSCSLSPYQSKKTFDYIRSIWLVFNSQVQSPRWLKKNDNEGIEWAWSYLSKKKDIKRNVLSWFKPADLNERYIGVMGAIDCWAIPSKLDVENYRKFLDDKSALLKKMSDSFKQRKRRSGKHDLTISAKASKELSELAVVLNKKEIKVIEKLIHDEYLRYKSKLFDYKNPS